MNIFTLVGNVAINREQAVKDINVIKKSAEGASTAMGRSFSKFTGYVKAHSDQIKKAGKTLTLLGGIATAAFAVSVKSAAKFEEELANVSTMLDKSAMKILPKYRDGLQDLSMEFGEATDTLSKGLYDILSASIPPAEALDVLAVSAKAASAGLTDTGTAADAITTVINSYGMAASDAGMVSDKLFAIVKRGKTTFGELAPAIGRVAATAAKSGLSFDELGATIATCTRAGINTREAMTSISGILKTFLKPQTDAVTLAWDKFGLKLDTTTLRTIGLTGVMKKLENATAEQLATIFGNIRGLKGMMAALGDAEGYAKDYALMLNSAGLTQEAFEKQSATLSFQLKQLKQTFNVVKVEIGTALVPTIKELTKWIMDIVIKVRDWMKANPELTTSIVKWAAGLSALMLVLGPLLMILPGLVTLLGGVSTALLAIGGPLAALQIALGLTVAQFALLAAEIAFIIGLVYKWKNAIVDAAEVSVLLGRQNAILASKQKELADRLGITVEQLKAWTKEGMGVKEMAERAGTSLEDLAKSAKSAFEKLSSIERLAKMFGTTVEKIKEFNEEGLSLTEMAERLGTTMEEVKERTRRLKNGTLELTEATADDTEVTKENIVAKVEQAKAIEKVLTGSALVTANLKLVKMEYELTSKNIADTNQNYEKQKVLLIELVGKLEQELTVLREGTKSYKDKQLAILNIRVELKELIDAQIELNKITVTQLTGIELINAKLSLQSKEYRSVGDSVDYFKERAGLLLEKNELLLITLEHLEKQGKQNTKEWFNQKEAIEDNEIAIEGLNEEYKDYVKKEWVKYLEKIAVEWNDLQIQMMGLGPVLDELGIKWRDVEKEAVEAAEESGSAWGDFFKELKAKYTDTFSALSGAISNFTSAFEGAIVDALTSLWHMAETNAEIQQQMAETEQEYIDEKEEMNEDYKQSLIQKLAEYVDEKELANMTIAELETLLMQHSIAAYTEMSEANQAKLDELADKYDEILGEMEGEQVTFASIMKDLWKKLVDAIITELIRLAAFYIVKWLFGLWFSGGGGVGYNLGGLAKGYDIGGRVKALEAKQNRAEYFAQGGPKGTDTVPAWLTPGEYVIDKPMTDFIRRTGAVTADLIRSIQAGSPTPEPSFASGGLVGAAGGGNTVELNILPGAIVINTKYLDDRAISQAGPKLFAEFEKQAGMLLSRR